jgi:hypothetical protein
VRVSHADVTDELRVFGQAGVDTFAVAPGVAALIALTTYPD